MNVYLWMSYNQRIFFHHWDYIKSSAKWKKSVLRKRWKLVKVSFLFDVCDFISPMSSNQSVGVFLISWRKKHIKPLHNHGIAVFHFTFTTAPLIITKEPLKAFFYIILFVVSYLYFHSTEFLSSKEAFRRNIVTERCCWNIKLNL